jgi:hypothetical protein
MYSNCCSTRRRGLCPVSLNCWCRNTVPSNVRFLSVAPGARAALPRRRRPGRSADVCHGRADLSHRIYLSGDISVLSRRDSCPSISWPESLHRYSLLAGIASSATGGMRRGPASSSCGNDPDSLDARCALRSPRLEFLRRTAIFDYPGDPSRFSHRHRGCKGVAKGFARGMSTALLRRCRRIGTLLSCDIAFVLAQG